MKVERWRQIAAIFAAAREHQPADRHEFVADACRGDPELRLEVDAMLAAHDTGGQVSDTGIEPVGSREDSPRSLYPGAMIGPYVITARLGAGGMGEVFRAHDARLRRDVAIKALSCMVDPSLERLARLRREARVLAALNHPHIAAIYGLEKFGDIDHLVLELVEGRTLSGPLVVPKALEYARQIAMALESAHAKGIVHRDLKPANVKVTPEGVVKVLDFGLAKGVSLKRDTAPLAASLVTGMAEESVAGHIVGSPAYMSPEQARGEDVDERTDIWAFGCVLYELLTGRRAFAGHGAAETLAATIGGEPDWDALPSDTPAPIRELLQRCLTKDSGRRIQAIVDVRLTIERAQQGWTRRQVRAIAAAACLAIVAGVGVWVRQPSPRTDPGRWLPVTRLSDAVSQPSLSADGRLVTFIRGGDTFYGPGQVYLKMLPDGEPVQLTDDTLKKMSPVFSPDGSRVAYTTVNRLFEWDTWIVAAAGGPPREWIRNASGLSWVSPQQVLFSEIRKSPHMGIVTADESGLGRREVYVPSNGHEMAHRSYVSPDRNWVLLVAMDKDHAWAPCRIVPMDGRSSGHEVGPPHAGCTSGAWSPDGKWIFVTSDAGGAHHIWRQRFPGGQPEQLTFGPTAEEGVTVSPDGHSLIASVALQSGSIWLHDAHGERQISALEGTAINAKFTRDGKRLCYLIVREYPSAYATQPGEIWMADLETGATAPLMPGFQVFDYDVSPDGTQVVMEGVDGEGRFRLWLAPLSQRSNARQIPNVEGRQPRYGRDGLIFFRASGFAYRVNEDGTGIRKAIEQPVLLLTGISPDGRWLVAWSPLGDENAMAFQAFSFDGAASIEISRDIDWKWSPDGSAVSISDGPVAANRSYIVPLEPGTVLPRLPAGGLRSEEEVAQLPAARRIDALTVPSPSKNEWAFYRDTSQRNLYRIAVP